MAVSQDGTPSGRSTDDYLAVLGDPNRRVVVGVLAETDRPISISSLAREVAAETQNASPDAKIAQTKLSLHHNHLPKLDAAGVVTYDSEERLVAPADGFETALSAVELAN
ncbi:DUF7344 domain-containing protein [Halopelagius inordinatus]|nr:helix-turn-helix transcriptional regulator [Halopelagius inordinatus]